MAFLPLYDQNPTRGRPWLNYGLIAANALAFVYSSSAAPGGLPQTVQSLGLVPARLLQDPTGQALTLGTSMFLHADWLHLGVNMLWLHIFGDNLEETLGRLRYGLLYGLCGIAAAAAQVVSDTSSQLPMVGASGAVGGVMGAYLLLFPRAPIVVLNGVPLLWFVIGLFPRVPAWLIGGEFVLGNLVAAVVTHGGDSRLGGVAVFAHLGGFAMGLIVVGALVSGRRRPRRSAARALRQPPRRGRHFPRA